MALALPPSDETNDAGGGGGVALHLFPVPAALQHQVFDDFYSIHYDRHGAANIISLAISLFADIDVVAAIITASCDNVLLIVD